MRCRQPRADRRTTRGESGSSCRTSSTEWSSPGTDLLRRQTARCLGGVPDGAWWPRSRDVATELPAWQRCSPSHLSPLTDIGLDTRARQGPHHPWPRRPLRPLGGAPGHATRRRGSCGRRRQPHLAARPSVTRATRPGGAWSRPKWLRRVPV
ncbi:DUF5994 family protein [Streptomyces laurentii]|uniref:DUF5994 family protein n=1 Tax=Streptomyces laurentii TaxID=39478 RepID=UPI0033DD86D4